MKLTSNFHETRVKTPANKARAKVIAAFYG